MNITKRDGTSITLTETEESDYNEISQIDSDVFLLEKEVTRMLKSVEDKRKALRFKGVMI